jgi:hypothetical protein
LIEFKVGPGLDFLRGEPSGFDFVFLDGDHSAPAVYQEVAAALPKLNHGAVILLHDYHPFNRHLFKTGLPIPGPYLAVQRIMEESLGINILPLGDLPWPTKDGLNKTCLALLCRKVG